MGGRRRLQIVAFTLSAIPLALAQKRLTGGEAKNHIGEQGTVCGKVVSTRFAESSRGRPTFLNFDQPYPNETFTIVIWGDDRSKFGCPETVYRGCTFASPGKSANLRGFPR